VPKPEPRRCEGAVCGVDPPPPDYFKTNNKKGQYELQ
jgi:hypothetical protein